MSVFSLIVLLFKFILSSTTYSNSCHVSVNQVRSSHTFGKYIANIEDKQLIALFKIYI